MINFNRNIFDSGNLQNRRVFKEVNWNGTENSIKILDKYFLKQDEKKTLKMPKIPQKTKYKLLKDPVKKTNSFKEENFKFPIFKTHDNSSDFFYDFHKNSNIMNPIFPEVKRKKSRAKSVNLRKYNKIGKQYQLDSYIITEHESQEEESPLKSIKS